MDAERRSNFGSAPVPRKQQKKAPKDRRERPARSSRILLQRRFVRLFLAAFVTSAAAGGALVYLIDERPLPLDDRLTVASLLPEADALARAAAWGAVRARTFSATVCLRDLPPRLGCGDLSEVDRHEVTTIRVLAPEREGMSFEQAVQELAGTWHSDGYELRIDGERSQANDNPAAPFEWKRFVIRQARDGSVIFAVGREIFTARLSADKSALTSTSFRGEKILLRN